MSIFYMAASDSEGKKRCKATKLGQAKREATRRFSTQHGDGYIHLMEVDDANTIIRSYTRYAARGNRWFSNDRILGIGKFIEEKLK